LAHLEFPQLALLRVGAPQIGAEADRHLALASPAIDLFAAGDRALQALDDGCRQMGFGGTLDPLHERYEGRNVERMVVRHHRDRVFGHEIGMLDGADARLEAAPHALVSIDVRHDVCVASRRLLDNGIQLFLGKLVACRMAFGREHHAARREQLDLRGALAQFFTGGLAHLCGAVGDYRHVGERSDMAAWIDCLVGCPEVGAAAGLGQRLSRIEQPRADDVPFGEQPGGRVIGAAGLADGRITVHQAVAQVVCRRDGDFRGGIGDVLRRQRQPGDMRMGVDQPGHQRSSANIDDCRIRRAERVRRHRHDAVIPYQHAE
jgi:hypothetical protein